MEVGERLKSLRSARGLTQTQLAGPRYTHAYVSAIESGRRRPSPKALEHFATKLGIELDELVTGRPPDLTARLTYELQNARVEVSRGEIDQAQQRLKNVLSEAQQHDDRRLSAKAYEGFALCEERRGRVEEAIDFFDQSIDLLRDESPLARVDAVTGKARCAQMVGDLRYAIYLLESLLENLEQEELSDPGALMRIHATLVRPYFDSLLYRKAYESASEALRLAPRIDDPVRLAQMYVNVGLVLIHRREIVEAEEALNKAEELYRQADLRVEIGRAHLARGFARSRSDATEDARTDFVSARAIFEETSSEVDEARALNELARMDRLEGNLVEARSKLQRSISLLRQKETDELAIAHREFGLCFLDDDPMEAEKHLRVALDLFEQAEDVGRLASTYRAIGDLLHARGDRDEGCDAYRTGILTLEERL